MCERLGNKGPRQERRRSQSESKRVLASKLCFSTSIVAICMWSIKGIASSLSARLIYMHSVFDAASTQPAGAVDNIRAPSPEPEPPLEAPRLLSLSLHSVLRFSPSDQVLCDLGPTPLDHVLDPLFEVIVLEPDLSRDRIACAARVAVPAKEAGLREGRKRETQRDRSFVNK